MKTGRHQDDDVSSGKRLTDVLKNMTPLNTIQVHYD